MPISDADIFAGDESIFEDITVLRELDRTLLEQERCTAPQAPCRRTQCIIVMEESLFEDIPALRELERTLFAKECCVAPQTPWHSGDNVHLSKSHGRGI